MSSTEMSGQTRASSCTFCVDDFHVAANHQSSDAKRLETLCVDVTRLQNEKHDLLRQNVSCKTDIKKLKDRLVMFQLNNLNSEDRELSKKYPQAYISNN